MSTEEDYKKFDLESMYQFWLKKMKLDERIMSPSQRIERKRSWMSGFHMCMISLLVDSNDTTSTEDFDKEVKSMMDQVEEFWKQSIKEADDLNYQNYQNTCNG